MLEIKNLKYKGLGPLDLDLGAGECLAVMGPSGAGKSLLLRAIADLDESEGLVSLDGVRREDMPAPEWRKRVAYVPAESGWWEETVGGHFPTGSDWTAMVGRLGLDAGCRDWSVSRLSTGERQRLALVRALCNRPQVLLLDEPTSGLDPEAARDVESVLQEAMGNGTAVLLVTHSKAQAERLARATLTIEDDAFTLSDGGGASAKKTGTTGGDA